MNISNSPDINNLLVNVVWDISGRTPIIRLENLSTGDNLANVSYAFTILSPSETSIWDGSLNQPDVTGVWTQFTFYSTNPDQNLSPAPTNYIVAPWPRPFNQIEWSGAPYVLTVLAKDSLNNTYELPVIQLICRPSGNVPTSITTYGKGVVALQIACTNANAFFEAITNTSYKGLSGTLESSQLRVNYPDDETDSAPQPFIINNFSTALVPITYDSNNYEYVYTSVYLYDFGNNSFVRVKYYIKERFSVNCNIDLCPLVCEYERLLQQAESGQCGDVVETNKKLLQINGKMNLAMIAKTQPLCGLDLSALIDEIKELGGFQCDCCTPSGISPFNSANLGDYNFQIIPGGGDINGTVNVVGNNIQFTLYDKNYIFKICDTAPTSAFTVTPSTSGFTRTYCLNVDMVQLAGDLLNTIKTNISLVNLFNSIVDFGSASTNLIVDGSCIFQSTSSCDYSYIVATVPVDTTYILLTSIKVGNVVRPIYFAFNQSNLNALQTHLNSLSIGNFSVTYLGSGNVSIVSVTNTFYLGDLTYQIGVTPHIATYSKNCTGFLPIDASQVVQAIIYYLCGLRDDQLVTSQIYTICYAVDNTGGSPPSVVNTVDIPAGTSLNILFAAMLDRNCQSISYLSTLGSSFSNGLTKVNNVVEFGGSTPLNKNTTLNQNDFSLTLRSNSFNYNIFDSVATTFVHSSAGGTNDNINILYHRNNLFVTEISTNGDRAALSYYAKTQISSNAASSTNNYSLIATHYPASLVPASPPPLDPNKTAFVRTVMDVGTGNGLVEIYGKEHTFTGDHTTFISFPVLPVYTTAARDSISITLLRPFMMIGNATTGKINFWDGTGWKEVTST